MELCHRLSFLIPKSLIMKSKNLLLFCLVLFILIPSLSKGAINPVYKECMQRGYNLSGDYCVFPDSSQCLLEDFNAGECGQKWMTDDYCIPQGNYVWDAERCCEGLVAYLPEGMAGQATCQSKQASLFKKIFFDYYGGAILLTLLLALLFLYFKRKRGKS